MSIILVPYNDSMRLGMGFNSYTQTLCIDRAVVFNAHKIKKTANVSQTVTYSSKLVEHLSQIATSLNVSHSVSIKKGTVEVAGNNNAINEEKVKQSDINAVVTVNVVNQTQTIEDDPEFNAMEGLSLQSFNDTYGDSYISGFIEGGNFNGVISMRVLDRSKKDHFVNSLKKSTSSGGKQNFTLDIDSFSTAMDNENVTNETETTISVSWMGGGQVKDSDVQWDLTSVMQAASKFPDLVAECPQRTWAILTKYKANRSYIEKMLEYQLSPLEYDLVSSYTSELFDNYMEYKQLVNNIQEIIRRPNDYRLSYKDHAISTETLSSLIAARAALRTEMSKIVKAVDVIARDPTVLETDQYLNAEPTDPGVKAFVDSVLHPEPEEDSDEEGNSEETSSQSDPISTSPAVTAPTTTGPTAIAPTDASSDDVLRPGGASKDGTGKDVLPGEKPAKKKGKGKARRRKPDTFGFDFSSMIAPELWAEVLPVLKAPEDRIGPDRSPEPANPSDMPLSLQAFFGPPPKDDAKDMAAHAKTESPAPVVPKNRILLATLGLKDVTQYVSSWVNSNGQIQFHEQDVVALSAQVIAWPSNVFQSPKAPNLVMILIYKLEGSNTTQMWAYRVLPNNPSNQLITLASNIPFIHTVADDVVYPKSPMAVVYSEIILDSKDLQARADLAQKVTSLWVPSSSNPTNSGQLNLHVAEMGIGSPHTDLLNAYYVFYRRIPGGQVYCAVGVEDQMSAIIPGDYLTISATR